MRLAYALFILSAAMGLSGDVTLRRSVSQTKPEVYKLQFEENRVMSSEYFPEDMVIDTFRKATVTLQPLPAPSSSGESRPEVTIRYVVDEENVEGPSDGLRTLPEPVEVKGRLDERGTLNVDLSKASVEEQATAFLVSAAGASLFVPLPDRSISIGDEWEAIVPTKHDELNPEVQKLKVKLMGKKTVGERSGWVLAVSGVVTNSITHSMSFEVQGKKVDQTIITKTVTDVHGDVVLDEATGQTIRAQTKLKQREETEFKSSMGDSKLLGKCTATYTVKSP